MKVSELIEILKTYPNEAKVAAEWDGMWSLIEGHSLEKDREDKEVVVLDASEWNSYQG